MYGSARRGALACCGWGPLNVSELLDDESLDLHSDFTEWLRSLREYIIYQANCGTTGVPRDLSATPPVSAPVHTAAVVEQRKSFAPEPPPAVPELTQPVPAAPVARAIEQDVDISRDEASRRLLVLQQEVAACVGCRLHETRTQTVFARGTMKSGICFIGEGPGADEDAQGFPFVGKAGQLLDRMVAAMGFARDDVYICNIVKCRPPNNRKPQPDEAQACRAFLEQQLILAAPEVIVALGATAVEGLLGVTEGITRMRGKWKLYQGKVPVMPTFHPAYLLRTPSAKHAVWDDMCEVLKHLGRPVPERGSRA